MSSRDDLEREQAAVRELEERLAAPLTAEAAALVNRVLEIERVLAEQRASLLATRARHAELTTRFALTKPEHSAWWFIATMPLSVVGGIVGGLATKLIHLHWYALSWGVVLVPFIMNGVRIIGATLKGASGRR